MPDQPAPIVFFDIASPDTARQKEFYSNVFGWNAGPTGNYSIPVVSPLYGTLRQDPNDKMLYIGVPDINATLAEITKHGGTMNAPRFEVPGVVILALFADPAGNRMGLVEMDGDKARIP